MIWMLLRKNENVKQKKSNEEKWNKENLRIRGNG